MAAAVKHMFFVFFSGERENVAARESSEKEKRTSDRRLTCNVSVKRLSLCRSLPTLNNQSQ